MSFEQTFDQRTDAEAFTAYREAKRFLQARGFSLGHMQARSPSGILFGDYDIQKWRNLSAADRAGLDGELTGDFRSGPVTIRVRGPWVGRLAVPSPDPEAARIAREAMRAFPAAVYDLGPREIESHGSIS